MSAIIADCQTLCALGLEGLQPDSIKDALY